MRTSLSKIAIGISAAALSFAVSAQETPRQSQGNALVNSQPKTGGWHFYEVEPKKKPKPKVAPPAPPAPAPPMPPAPPPPPPPPPALSAEWIKENLPKYMTRALDDPSKENVEIVAYLQRLSMDKAERYAQAMAMVPINNPVLDEYARSALTTVQRNTREGQVNAKRKEIMTRLSQRVGLWYFYMSTCPYCARQEPILEMVMKDTGLSVLPISLDGGAPPTAKHWEFVVNDGHASQLGVVQTPTIVVADTDTGQLHNLTAGLRTVSEIENRLLELARASEWITPAEFDEATRGEPRMFLTDGLKGVTDIPDDPAQLLEVLRRAQYNGDATPWVVTPNSEN